MPANPTVLHYVGSDDDRGGIVSVVRALATTQRFPCILGVNTGCVQRRDPPLAELELPRLEGEAIGPVNLWRARVVAREVQKWLRAAPERVFHGHSRAGLLVALWLVRWGEKRVVVSVHCYGKQRWFYRWASRQLGGRLFWLSPAMRCYYHVGGSDWSQCMPECLNLRADSPSPVVVDGRVRLAGVGFLIPWKGWHHVVEAFALLPAEIRSRLSFRHIGTVAASEESARYAEALYARTTDARLTESIQWLGEQPSSAPLLADCDCLIVASQNEPFSLAMLEALDAGVKLIAADSGGATDLVRASQNGLLFRTGSPEDLARVLRSLVETDALVRVQIDRGALQRFSAPVVAGKWLEIYSRL